MKRSSFITSVSATAALVGMPLSPAVAAFRKQQLTEWFASENAWRLAGGAEVLKRVQAEWPHLTIQNTYAECDHAGCGQRVYVATTEANWTKPGPDWYVGDKFTVSGSMYEAICDNTNVDGAETGQWFTDTGWIVWTCGHGSTNGVCPEHWADCTTGWFDKYEHTMADCPRYTCKLNNPEIAKWYKCNCADPHRFGQCSVHDHSCYAGCGDCYDTDHECVSCGQVEQHGDYGDLCVLCVFVKGRDTLTNPIHVAYADHIIEFLRPLHAEVAR